MGDAELLTEIKECIKESRKQADPERDGLFLTILEKLDRRMDKELKKLERAPIKICSK